MRQTKLERLGKIIEQKKSSGNKNSIDCEHFTIMSSSVEMNHDKKAEPGKKIMKKILSSV